MPAKAERKVLQVGGSKVAALPPNWLRMHKIDVGDSVEVIYNSFIMIIPKGFRVNSDFTKKEIEIISRLLDREVEY